VGPALEAPFMASTSDGAGAGSCSERGVKRTMPEAVSQARSPSRVSSGSPV